MIFDLIKTSVKETRTRGERVAAYYDEHRPRIVAVAQALGKLEDKIIRVDVTAESVDIYISGDRHVLKAAFGALRRLEYHPDSRPDAKPEPTFSTWFRHPDHSCKFWLSFSSTQCTRVKVGSKMEEVNVYETVCK